MAAYDILVRAAKRKPPRRGPGITGTLLETLSQADAIRPRRAPEPDTRGTPTLDGAVRHPLVGDGYLRHPLLQIYKHRARRRFN